MPSPKPSDLDFEIHVDPSCLSAPMDEESTPAVTEAVENESPVAPEALDEKELEQAESQETAQVEDEPGQEDPVPSIEGADADVVEEPDAEAEREHPEEESNAGEHEEQETVEGEHIIDEAAEEEHKPECYSEAEDEHTPQPTQVLDYGIGETGSQLGATDRKTSLRTEALIQAAAREVVAKIEARARERHSGRYSNTAEDSILSSDTRDEAYDADGADMSYLDKESDTGSRRHSSESQIHHHIATHSISGDSSSHREADDEDEDDVFSDRSPRSSLGSMDGANDVGGPGCKSPKTTEGTGTKSPRISRISDISGLSQYEREEQFTPTSRGRTPRIPFRTPSSVRAIQMSSPAPSVYSVATPRSTKRQSGFCGSPQPPVQYSPKGRPTPPRFAKVKEPAPLVLLHVTLMPLRWMWADVLDGMDAIARSEDDDNNNNNSSNEKGDKSGPTPTFEPSDQLKTLRDSWRQLQDRIGDTVLERGVLLPHPQNDYEVLEERLLEALELPLRRRARILECGHYIGPADDVAEDGEEETDASEDEYSSRPGIRHGRDEANGRRWCGTCRREIRYEDLGPGKVFRVKVYASNGLMKAGAWAACWKEMERVDIELEPIVETALHRELERLAAVQEERERRRLQMEGEEEQLRQQQQQEEEEEEQLVSEGDVLPVRQSTELYSVSRAMTARSPMPSSPPQVLPLAGAANMVMHASPLGPVTSSPSVLSPALPSSPLQARVISPPAARQALGQAEEPIDAFEERRYRDEERLREIYGRTPPRGNESQHTPRREEAAYAYAEAGVGAVPSSPASPSRRAFDRQDDVGRDERAEQQQHHHYAHDQRYHDYRPQRNHHQQHEGPYPQNTRYQTASLLELLLESGRVLLRDRRNVAIALLGFCVAMLAVRPAQTPAATLAPRPGPVPAAAPEVVRQYHRAEVHFREQELEPRIPQCRPVAEPVPAAEAIEGLGAVEMRYSKLPVAASVAVARDPPARGREDAGATAVREVVYESVASSSSLPPPETTTTVEREVVRVFETVTETVRVSVTVAEEVRSEATTVTENETESVTESEMATETSTLPEIETSTLVQTEMEAASEFTQTDSATVTDTASEASMPTASAAGGLDEEGDLHAADANDEAVAPLSEDEGSDQDHGGSNDGE